MLTNQQLINLQNAAIQSRKCELDTGIPAELMVSQWVLESGWGSYSPGNNCFGIKEYKGCAGRQLLLTFEWFSPVQREYFVLMGDGRTATPLTGFCDGEGRDKCKVQDWFATFNTLADCFTKRAALFTAGPYKESAKTYAKTRNPIQLIHDIAPIYAKSSTYADTLIRILSQPEVVSAIAASRLP